MELSKYEVFLKTVELGNITQAAEFLGYTQPAVSRVIAIWSANGAFRF